MTAVAPNLSLDGPALERALPFRLTWEASGRLLWVSDLLRRYWDLGDATLSSIDVRLIRPFRASLEPRFFGNLTGMALEIGCGGQSGSLNGELLELADGSWLFVGMPAIVEIAQLDRTGVTLGELPTHMGLGYLLLATETTRIANEASAESTRQRIAAESASRAKAEFVANMSHELRTPLTAIMGFLKLCLQYEQNERQLRYLQKADIASQTLLALIGDVLDFSKLEADRVQLDIRPFEIVDIVSRAQAMFADLARSKGLKFYVDVEGWPPSLNGDENRINQVLTNLIGNAIKFTSQGAVRLSVIAKPSTDDQVSVEFRVTDTGIGIPASQVPLVMMAFHQADVSTTRQFGGTGLGLAISQQLVKLTGGRLDVDSQAGVGSVFSFRLDFPIARGAAPRTPAALQEVRGAATAAQLAGARVLVVEDHPVNQEVIFEMLRSVDVATTLAGSGAEALAALASDRPFDLVLMDVQMPDMDGLETTRRIRALAGRGQIPIVALTAHATREERQRCIDAGMDDFETKPIDAERLFACLIRWYRNRPELPMEKRPLSATGVVGTSAPPIDHEALSRLFGHDERKIRQVTDKFLEISHATISSMQEQLASRDVDGVRRSAHYLRGAAATLKANRFAELCEDLEAACETTEFVLADRLLTELRHATEEFKTVVTTPLKVG